MTIDFALRFCIVFASVRCRFGLPNGSPGVCRYLWSGPLGGSKTVLKSSWFGSLVVLSFGIAFLVVLGSSWGRFWSSGAPLRVVFGRSGGRFGAFSAFQLIDSTRQLINSSIQLINSSTHQPMALRHFLTRPGGLRAARLNPPPGPKGRDERRVRSSSISAQSQVVAYYSSYSLLSWSSLGF